MSAVYAVPLGGNGQYAITHDGNRWWNFPYTAYSPTGRIIGCASTLRGARRLIRKDRQRPVDRSREREVLVHEETP